MITDSTSARTIFRSPQLLLLFLILPVAVILALVLHIKLPFLHPKYLLIANNLCLCLLAAVRFVHYSVSFRNKLRYEGFGNTTTKVVLTASSRETIRSTFVDSGFVFGDSGSYGEKRDYGYFGTILFYGGLFLVLFTGSVDNMFQFSGTIQDSVGVATDLKVIEKYRNKSIGLVTSDLSTLPKMKIVRQFFPSGDHPSGATEVAFQFPDGSEQQIILKSPVPFRAGSYDIYMSRLVYEPKLVITLNDSAPVFSGKITLNQIPGTINGFNYRGTFSQDGIDGIITYQPEQNRFKVVVTQGSQQLIDTELVFQVDKLSRSANFSIMCESMGVWSEIYVVHRRHMNTIFFGVFIILLGAVLRLMFSAQRVWLEQTADGCEVRTSGKVAGRCLDSSC